MIRSLGPLTTFSTDLLPATSCLHFSFVHEPTYLENAPPVLLQVLLFSDGTGDHAVISDAALPPLETQTVIDTAGFADLARRLGTRPICLSSPMPLSPVFIPKPWGREIWFSGIEERGVADVSGVPLAWLLDIFGEWLGCNGAPLLLKILDPHSDANLGDLYFEMHEKKVEVYVVTHVDEVSWPDGKGQIRYGFNQALLARYRNAEAFLAAYLEAVADYQAVRGSIDDALSGLITDEGLERPLSPHDYTRLLQKLPRDTLDKEARLREHMYAFTALTDLRVGDVVRVKPLVPHSLQHGVRVIEFQTPHYERYILSFGQQVLTQSHWDTADAISRAVLEVDDIRQVDEIAPGHALIADFDEFRVHRLTIPPGGRLQTRHPGYTLIIGVSGQARLTDQAGETRVDPEAAFFIAPREALDFHNAGDGPATLLVAEEKRA